MKTKKGLDEYTPSQEIMEMLTSESIGDISKRLIKNYAEQEAPAISPDEGRFMLRYLVSMGYLDEYRIWRSYYFTIKRKEHLMALNCTLYSNSLHYICERIKMLEVLETIQGLVSQYSYSNVNDIIRQDNNAIVEAILPLITGRHIMDARAIKNEEGWLMVDLVTEWRHLHTFVEETLRQNIVDLIGQCKAVERFAKKHDVTECIPRNMKRHFSTTKTDYLKQLNDEYVEGLRFFRKKFGLPELVSVREKKRALTITGEMKIQETAQFLFTDMEDILRGIQACENGQ